MQAIVLAAESTRQELSGGKEAPVKVVWIRERKEFLQYPAADIYLDLEHNRKPEDLLLLQRLLPAAVVIGELALTLRETNDSFIRINSWPGFVKGNIVEGSCGSGKGRESADRFFAAYEKTIEWLPDEPGFITARVVSMIINEAYFALEDGVSTKEEIDTAMKLGTNYPYGPFEWARMIGTGEVARLLARLAANQPRYTPSRLLLEAASLPGTILPNG